MVKGVRFRPSQHRISTCGTICEQIMWAALGMTELGMPGKLMTDFSIIGKPTGAGK